MTAPGELRSEAATFLSRRLQPAIFNHSRRVYELAKAIAEHEGCAVDLDALHIASLFHDAGTADEYDGPQRFEIEGADAAAAFLADQGWDAHRIDDVWEAIALHTSPQIAERRGPLTRYLRLGVRTDFGDLTLLPGAEIRRVEIQRTYPRLMIEKVLEDAVVSQALRNENKAPSASWPAALLQAHRSDPGRPGISPAF
ncbi:HD domain-containing protein [Arthrobacter globiformis]|uniref:HD domain-containing protein n=1 Tax=Arthrobacter globiformis TaxID=1665 RepID=UPI00397C3982